MPDTDQIVTLRTQVFGLFHEWAGAKPCLRVLAQFPSLEIYLAGGVVRNAVLGREVQPKDFDLFLGGDSVDAALQAWSSEGRTTAGPYGCPRWSPGGTGAYCDMIPIRRFTPGLWPCEDIVDVLNQFDFTGNALAFDLRDGVFFNPQNGLRDMRRRSLRAVRFDYPDEPFMAGQALGRRAILWFRLLHYAATLGLELEPITRQWLIDGKKAFGQKAVFAASFFEPAVDRSTLHTLGIYV